MSSQDENDEHEARMTAKSVKKRRVGRACDLCRQKKVRCDGEQRPGKRCSNCTAYDDECTYVQSAPKRRSRPKGYVEHLEARLAKMEDILEKLAPGADLQRDFQAAMEESQKVSEDESEDDQLEGTSQPRVQSPITDNSFDYAIPPSLITHATSPHTASYLPQLTDAPEEDEDELEPSDDELLTRHNINRQFSGMTVDGLKSDRRFFGKSSSFMIVKAAVDLKQVHHPGRAPPAPSTPRVAITFPSRDGEAGITYLPCGCPDHGPFHPWVAALPPYKSPEADTFIFPPNDLIPSLVSLYFTMHNDYIPILHRPTFDRCMREGRHLHDEDFASIVLLVCSIGARWSKDRRVLLEEDIRVNDDDEGEEEEEWHSAGWRWFRQLRLGRKALFSAPALCDIQLACLSAIFMRGSSTSDASRTIIGVGLRLAQDIGAHRKKMYSFLPAADGEMMKRTFWSLVWLDWAVSPQLGRPCGIQHEDFDLDLPIECDDEYWGQSEQPAAFNQPPDKPSKVTFFNCFLRLNQIQAFAMRTIYSTTKSKTILGFVGTQWEERIVAELDSALNSWMDSVPPHLRWNPRATNDSHLSQSAILYAAYCALQITIHRPFISYTHNVSSTNSTSRNSRFPSLTICVNAARSCVHVLDFIRKKFGQGSELAAVVLHYSLIPLFNCGIVLMLNMWGKGGSTKGTASRNGNNTRDPVAEMREMVDVHAVMDMLKIIETRWHAAGRLWDMLYELAVVGDLPLPSSSHASVIRSSNQRFLKAKAAAMSGADASKKSNTATSQASVMRNALVPIRPKPPTSTASTNRSALNQALYPKHAHLFGPQEQKHDSRFEYDLSPSVFTQSNHASQPSSSTSNGNNNTPMNVDTLSMFSTAHAGLSSQLAAEDAVHKNSYPLSSSGSSLEQSSTPIPSETTSMHADWAPFTKSSEVISETHSQTQQTRIISPKSHTRPGSFSNSPPATVYATPRLSQGDAAPTSTISSPSLTTSASQQPPNANPVSPSSYRVDPTNFVTATQFIAGMAEDVFQSRETLAMWSAAPPGFDWNDWGTYIHSFEPDNASTIPNSVIRSYPMDQGYVPDL